MKIDGEPRPKCRDVAISTTQLKCFLILMKGVIITSDKVRCNEDSETWCMLHKVVQKQPLYHLVLLFRLFSTLSYSRVHVTYEANTNVYFVYRKVSMCLLAPLTDCNNVHVLCLSLGWHNLMPPRLKYDSGTKVTCVNQRKIDKGIFGPMGKVWPRGCCLKV